MMIVRSGPGILATLALGAVALSAGLAGCVRNAMAIERSSTAGQERSATRRATQGGPRVSGGLEGVVRLAPDGLPQPTRVENATDPQVCGSEQTLEDLRVDPQGRGVRDVILALVDVPAECAPAPPPGRLILDNSECRFVPHAAVLTAGSTIETTNSDPVLHTVHFYGPIDKNLALPFRGVRRTLVVDRPGLFSVRCDVHGWMRAFVRVDPHPFHAVSDPGGEFRIEGIPPGAWTLEAWHERLGRQRLGVTIEPGKTARVEITYAWRDSR